MTTVKDLEVRTGLEFFDYQKEAFADFLSQDKPNKRLTLYYRTGAGKTITALAALALAGWQDALVVAPPVIHDTWIKEGRRFGINVEAISHAKFRMRTTKIARTVPILADEFHLFGGHGGQGWKKLDKVAAGLLAPMILMSATPNYNDADRVYCIQHVMNPHSCRGGFLSFIYANCTTEPNHFATMPNVTGFLRHKDAAQYLASLPHVHHVPDNVIADIVDIPIFTYVPKELETFGLNRRKGRIMASQMEARHARAYDERVDTRGLIHDHIMDHLYRISGEATTPVLMFCASEKIATILATTLDRSSRTALVTGRTPKAVKQLTIERFKQGEFDALIGTATLATGTDGLDKMCDTLVIVHDTDDDALRRQLIGRILPRGADVDASGKHVYRLAITS